MGDTEVVEHIAEEDSNIEEGFDEEEGSVEGNCWGQAGFVLWDSEDFGDERDGLGVGVGNGDSLVFYSRDRIRN